MKYEERVEPSGEIYNKEYRVSASPRIRDEGVSGYKYE